MLATLEIPDTRTPAQLPSLPCIEEQLIACANIDPADAAELAEQIVSRSDVDLYFRLVNGE